MNRDYYAGHQRGLAEGEERAIERIIKLLEDTARTWRNLQYDNQADIFEHAIALIQGENK